jgi:hypothetical protein
MDVITGVLRIYPFRAEANAFGKRKHGQQKAVGEWFSDTSGTVSIVPYFIKASKHSLWVNVCISETWRTASNLRL